MMASGGKRAGSGRKVLPAAVNASKGLSKVEAENRAAVEKKLQVRKTLRPPKWLSPDAKKEWKRVMRLYNEMEVDILSDLDQAALVVYCEAWATYKEALDKFRSLGNVASTNPSSQRLIDKLITIMNTQSDRMLKVQEQLCLSPVGRAKMGMHITNTESSKLASFLNDWTPERRDREDDE